MTDVSGQLWSKFIPGMPSAFLPSLVHFLPCDDDKGHISQWRLIRRAPKSYLDSTCSLRFRQLRQTEILRFNLPVPMVDY